jgi:hypothetical protein
MSDGYIASQVSRTTRNLLLVNLTVAAIAAACFWPAQKYILSTITGPADIDAEAAAKAKSADEVAQYYVTYKAEKVFDSGLTLTVSSRKSGTSKYRFALVLVAGRAFVVKVNDGEVPLQAPGPKVFTGNLKDLPAEVRAKIDEDLNAKPAPGKPPRPRIELAAVMLDASDGPFAMWFLFLLIGIPFAVAVWNINSALMRSFAGAVHPIRRQLAKLGDAEKLEQEIDNQAAGGKGPTSVLGNLTVTDDWLLVRDTFTVRITPLDKLAWIYQKTTQHSTNGIPTHKTYAATIHDREGGQTDLSARNEEGVKDILVNIAARRPWLLMGFDEELEKDWKNKRAEVIAVLDERKRRFEQGPVGEPAAAAAAPTSGGPKPGEIFNPAPARPSLLKPEPSDFPPPPPPPPGQA